MATIKDHQDRIAQVKQQAKKSLVNVVDKLTKDLALCIEDAIKEHHNGYTPYTNNLDVELRKFRGYIPGIMVKLLPDEYDYETYTVPSKNWWMIKIFPRPKRKQTCVIS